MRSPLFSTYRGGENRVTSSLIAVFERIDLSLVERLLGGAAGDANLSMVTFENQITGDQATVPDAGISANFKYLFEVKIANETVRPDQIAGHLKHLTKSHADERLFVLTTDAVQPAGLGNFHDDPRVYWTNFASLNEAISQVLDDSPDVVGERTTFLLRELQALFQAEGLLDFSDTVVVAARSAYPEYLERSAYICQPGRSFQPGIRYFGFYADGEIKPQIATIRHIEDQVLFSRSEAESRSASDDSTNREIGQLIKASLDEQTRAEGQSYKVFLLSGPEDAATIVLTGPIVNDTKSRNGGPWAWTLGQRYANLDRLRRNPAKTSELA